MNVFNALAPVFLIIALGVLLRKFVFLRDQHFDGLNKLTYWVGLPCLLFSKIAATSIEAQQSTPILFVVLAGMTGTIIIGLVLAKLLSIRRQAVGTFVQAGFRGNLAFIGLPVIMYSVARIQGLDSQAIETLAVLVIAPMVPTYNILSVLALLASQQELTWRSAGKLIQPVISNPLVLASVIAAPFAILKWPVPTAVARTTHSLGLMSLPLALVSIGSSLVGIRVRGSLALAGVAAFIKVAMAPALGLLIARWLDLGIPETRIALIYLACPTAAASYVMVDQIGGDKALAASAIVVSTLLAMISLSVAIALPL